MKRILLGLTVVGLASLGAMSCASDPTGELNGTPAAISASLTDITMAVGDTVQVIARTLDGQGVMHPSAPEVTSQTPNVVAVNVVDEDRPLPETVFLIAGLSIGEGTVALSQGGASGTISVHTVPAAIAIEGPASIRSGESSTYTATAVDRQGNPVTGDSVGGIVFVSDSSDILALDSATLVITSNSVSMTGTAEIRGGGGLTARIAADTLGTLAVVVTPGPGVTATLGSFGALAAGDMLTLEVVVTDAAGNQNNRLDELTSPTATSSDNAIATVAVSTVDTTADNFRAVFVEVTAVGSGLANVTGSVGGLAFGPAPAEVLNPVITPATPSSAPGATVTINGTGLAAVTAGIPTFVLVDGAIVGNITVVSSSQIDAVMPTLVAGTYDLEVNVGGIISNADSWTQVGDFDEAASEPNDAQGQEVPITGSFEFSGTADETTDFSDLFEFTVTEDNLVVDLELAWGDDSDIDLTIYPKGAQDPGTYVVGNCGYALSSVANPETGECPLATAGTYTLEIVHYGTGPTTYTVKGRIRQAN